MSPVAVLQDRGEHRQAAGAITALNAKQPKQGRPRWRPFSFDAGGTIHRAIAVAVQGFLAELNGSFVALMEAIVQINMNAELLRLVRQLLNKFGIGKLG
jgi:hypothetical protein